jgi:hypothetical protein
MISTFLGEFCDEGILEDTFAMTIPIVYISESKGYTGGIFLFHCRL